MVRLALAVVAGLVLASFPFLRYVHLGGPGEGHSDHEPHHGGQLGMTGDHHIEVLRRHGKVEAFVSDAWRRSVRPREGWAVFDGGPATPMVWEDQRLVGVDDIAARVIETIVVLPDGRRLSLSFDFDPTPAEQLADQ